ncbi:TPA: hypothetical protein N0F65_002722 [Lagenidium giganteum]|uniref:PX domain-containing protein n=1 Tax=Lagenidium giganteum TaxID=4803 RepID=A0AAV2Z533_9STRA|nr:TPA: hypothetical protein N0F65_002722 [Lagenidium giganteum]
MPASLISAHLGHAPALHPKPLVPQRPSPVAAPLEFLRKIQVVEINNVKVLDGVVYYVLDVYLKHSRSHIPTSQLAESPLKRARPDYQLLKRYTEFETLRGGVWSYAQVDHSRIKCPYCDGLMNFVMSSVAQPRLVVKLLMPSTDHRKKVLASFVNRFIELSIGEEQSQLCHGFEAIPILVHDFIRREEQ